VAVTGAMFTTAVVNMAASQSFERTARYRKVPNRSGGVLD